MNDSMPSNDPRREHELLADRALFGLSPEEQHELAQLLGPHAEEIDDLALTAAALDVGLHRGGHAEALPSHLRDRILQATRSAAPATLATPQRTPDGGSRGNRRELLGWIAAAAATAAAVYFGTRPTAPDANFSPAALRAELLALQQRGEGAVVKLDWTRGEDPAAADAGGDVIWSAARQQGVMRFAGLAANDPAKNQYQLWVFDAARDEKYPVDGGVFDIPPGAKEVLVPIRTRLPIEKVTLFAITVEPPGGVVVSDRSRLPLLAPVK